jgi:hypothetical protein
VTKNAAVAIVLGVDPKGYLHAKGVEERVLAEAMNQAASTLAEQRRNEVEAIGAACARALARMIKKR